MSFLAVKTEQAEQWVEDNLCIESWQRTGNIIGIDHHYIEDIVDGMIEDDLQPGEDFELF